MLLRTLQAPPPQGSLQEWALIFLLDRLEDIEHARFRALAQIIVDKEEGAKAFEDYMNIAFPSLAQRKKKREEQMKKLLTAWTSIGGLKVTPLTPLGGGKSKMKTVAARHTASDKHVQLYNQLRERAAYGGQGIGRSG